MPIRETVFPPQMAGLTTKADGRPMKIMHNSSSESHIKDILSYDAGGYWSPQTRLVNNVDNTVFGASCLGFRLHDRNDKW